MFNINICAVYIKNYIKMYSNVLKYIQNFASPGQRSCLYNIASKYGVNAMIQASQPPIPKHIPNLYDHIDELIFDGDAVTNRTMTPLTSDASFIGRLVRGENVLKNHCSKITAYIRYMDQTTTILHTCFWCMFTKTELPKTSIVLTTDQTKVSSYNYLLGYSYPRAGDQFEQLYTFPLYNDTENDEAYFTQSNFSYSPALIWIYQGQVRCLEDQREYPPLYNFSRYDTTYGEEFNDSYFIQRNMYVVNYDKNIYVFDDNLSMFKIPWDSDLYLSYYYIGQTQGEYNAVSNSDTEFYNRKKGWTDEEKEMLKQIYIE